jgi:chemotaxis protein MotB
MRTCTKGRIVLPAALVVALCCTGCTNWEQKYKNLSVEHENVKGLLENCQQTSGTEKSTMTTELSRKQQAIDDLQKQIVQMKRSPGSVTGFGDEYQVDVNAAAGTITVTLPTTILFDAGKADLKKASHGQLDHIVSVLRQRYSGRNVDVLGHTDSDPIKKSKWKDNWELSSARSLAVLRYIESRGLPVEKLRAVGCGPSRPVAPNTTATSKAKNRRVEIVVNMR